MDWLDNNVSKRLEKIADELLGEVNIIYFTLFCFKWIYFILIMLFQSFLNECCLNEMVGSTSEVLEPSQNIDDLHNVDINEDSLFMLNTDTDTDIKIPIEETKLFTIPDIKECKIEEQSETDESDALERFIIVEEAIEEVTTTYDEHILEICEEDDNMDTEQYEDFGYESLSSPEYDYKTQYTPQTLTDFL